MQLGSRIVALIGGHIILDPARPGQFRTSHPNETQYGIIGDMLRGEATAVLYHQQPRETTVVVVGGVTPLHRDVPDAPHLSAVVRQELLALGVPRAVIQELDIDPNCGTANQLLHLSQLITSQPQTGTLLLVSNWWHLTRIEALILFQDELTNLRSGRPRVILVRAEDVLLTHDPSRWHDPISTAYRSAEMRATLRRELKGAHDIATGAYTFPTGVPGRFLHEGPYVT